MMFSSLAISLWFFVAVDALCVDALLLRHEKTTPAQHQRTTGLRGIVSAKSSGHHGVVVAVSDRKVSEDETIVDEAEGGEQPVATKNTLRFLLLGDWGKGGNSGKYMSSFNMTLFGNETLEDSSDLSGAMSFAGTNATATVQGGGNQAPPLYQPQVANAMGTYAANANPAPSFVVALGDNFYTKGVSSATDSLWQYLWEDVYLGYNELNIPWYPVFGNHDYGSASAVQAQIDRYNLHMNGDIWQFPSTNYSKIFDIPGNEGASVGIVFIDSTTLAPSMNGCCNSKGGISEEEQAKRIKNQLYHINRMLEELVAAQVTWLLVAGHYPVFSAGSSGDPLEMTTNLLPLLKKYNVHAYICGHDHISQHLKYKNCSTQFFIAGAGSMTDSLYYKSTADLVWGGPNYAAFGYIEATSKYLQFGIIDTNNDVKYQYNLTNPFTLKVPFTLVPTSSPSLSPSTKNTPSSSPSSAPSSSPSSVPSSSPSWAPSPSPTRSPTTNEEIGQDESGQGFSALMSLSNSNGAIVLIAGSMALVGILIAVFCLFGCSSNAAAAKSKSKNEDKDNKASDKSLLLKATSSSKTTTLPTEEDEEHGNILLPSHRISAKHSKRNLIRRRMMLTAAYEALREEDQQDATNLSRGSDFEPKPLAVADAGGMFQLPSKAPPSTPIDQSKGRKRSLSLQSKGGDILSIAIGEVSAKVNNASGVYSHSSKGGLRTV